LAEHSLEPGLALARAFEAQVTLLRVLEPAEELDEEERARIQPEEEAWLFTLPEVMHRMR
jgi:hypothetical protein